MPRVLVLLASRNGADWIRCQIESILAQKGVDVRVIMRDDCSSDATVDEAGSLIHDGRVILTLSHTPAGSAAQNFLALIHDQSAEGFDFVSFADQDDVWHPDKLQRACLALERTRAGGYSSSTLATWKDGRSRVLRQSPVMTNADFLLEGAGQGCTFVLSADFYARVRQFVLEHQPLTRQVHYHDWMVYALARCWERSWSFDPLPSIDYRQHKANDTGARLSAAGIRKRLHLIRSGWYRTQLTAVAALCSVAAPANPVVADWMSVLRTAGRWRRGLKVARFCMINGRRRRLDNAILVAAALFGWF
ncbi:MAG: glycosyltransferase [Steroidobacteraceae bacterium]